MKKCSKCKVEKQFTCFHKDTTKSIDGFASCCKECKRKIDKEYRKIKVYNKEYRKNNKEKTNKYITTRRKTDSLFKLQCCLRNRTSIAFKSKGYSKKTNTQKILGTDWEVCRVHVEQ